MSGTWSSFLEASQAALLVSKGETSTAREMLSAADAHVAGRVSF